MKDVLTKSQKHCAHERIKTKLGVVGDLGNLTVEAKNLQVVCSNNHLLNR